MQQVGRDAQRTRPARSVQRLDATGLEEWMARAEEKLADGARVGRVADDGLVELRRLRVEDALFCLGDRVKNRRDAALVDIDAGCKADLLGPCVGPEGLGQTEDAVGWRGLEGGEGARHLRIVATSAATASLASLS